MKNKKEEEENGITNVHSTGGYGRAAQRDIYKRTEIDCDFKRNGNDRQL